MLALDPDGLVGVGRDRTEQGDDHYREDGRWKVVSDVHGRIVGDCQIDFATRPFQPEEQAAPAN
jgi:hypothetical protein